MTDIQNVEIDPLSDDELDSVAGGLGVGSVNCCCTTGNGNCSAAPPTPTVPSTPGGGGLIAG